tara:strand:+ start:4270 stop:6288 length:2019 start_codon:yes stop_codon:yes gene_type:complete
MAGSAKDIQEVAHTFDNLTDSIQKAATTSGKLRDTFLQLSKTTTSSGQAWTVLSRLSSGSGFWKIQNRIRSISNFLQYQDYKAQEMAKHEKEAIANLGEQMKLKKDIQNASKVLSAVTDGTASTEERIMFYQSEQFKYLEQMYGKEEAMVTMRDKLKYASEQLAITDKSMLDNRVKQQKIVLEKSLGGWGKFWDVLVSEDTQYKRFMNMNIENQRTFMEFSDATDRLQGQKNDKLKIEQEMIQKNIQLQSKTGQYDRAKMVGSGKTDSEKEDLLTQRRKLQAEFDKLTEYRKNINEELAKTAEDIMQSEDYLKYQGVSVGVDAQGKAEIDKDTEKEPLGKKMMKKLTGFIEKVPGGAAILKVVTLFPKLYTGLKVFWALDRKDKLLQMKGGIIKLATKIAKPLGMVLRGFLIYFPLVLLLLYMLKRTGWLDVILGLIYGIGHWIMLIFQGIIEFSMSVGAFVSSIIDFIGILFNGTSSEAFVALGEVLSTFGTMLLELGELIIWDLIMGIFRGPLVGMLTALGEQYFGPDSTVLGGIVSLLVDMGIMFGAWKVAHMAYIAFGPIGGLIAFLTVWLMGDWFKNLVNDALGFADGGTVHKSGSYLVGERGPEIVSMKGGSYVTPNHQLGGSTTINISVNGRIGASDSELNDIANKLSNIINQRMQRAGTSGVFR